MRTLTLKLLSAVAMTTLLSALPAMAQYAMPDTKERTSFKDTSLLKPANGAKVSIIEFEDLECPLCARAFPVVHAAMAKYQIPLERHDFLISYHVWSAQAAVTARYLDDFVSSKAAEAFRGDVFAHQNGIASKEDLAAYTRRWFQQHQIAQPFVVDPKCQKEVTADCNLGARMGLGHTPTLVVVSKNMWVEVMDPSQLYAAIERVEASTRSGR